MAKLRHSIISKYDCININDHKIELSKDKFSKIVCDDNKSYGFLKSSYYEILKSFSIDDEIIKIIEASLFFSMLPLHSENKRKILGFYITAAILMNDF